MRVRFLAAYTFVPPEKISVSVVYPAGHEGQVRRICGERAIAQGKAEEIDRPRLQPDEAS